MIFQKVDFELSGNSLKLSAECNGVLVVIELSRNRLSRMFPDEFMALKPILYFKEVQYVPSGDLISIELWHQEYMSKKRAEQIFASASVDDITEIITND